MDNNSLNEKLDLIIKCLKISNRFLYLKIWRS